MTPLEDRSPKHTAGGVFCDDCGYACVGGCVFVRDDEQPIFQAFRLARRLPPSAAWATWDFMSWVGGMWSAFDRATGAHERTRPYRRDAFREWTFAAVGYPALRLATEPTNER